jgi:hypothetical protein
MICLLIGKADEVLNHTRTRNARGKLKPICKPASEKSELLWTVDFAERKFGRMQRSKTTKVCVTLAWLVLGIILIRQVSALTDITMVMCNLSCPWLVSSSAIARNLKNNDQGDIVYDSLSILGHRKNPIVVNRAIELLKSKDDYTWLNAAIYLGACGRQEAVPYLIKALRHTASKSYQEESDDLQDLTGQNFGTDFKKWKTWWEQSHPDSNFDWQSHLGFNPQLNR